MKKTNRLRFAITGALFCLFALLTILLTFVDVRPIGPNGSPVGFAALNVWAASIIGVHMRLYEITDWLGLLAIACAFGFAIVGLAQLIARKSLLRVDLNILLLGAFYLLVIAAYIAFEFFSINYRPVLIENVLEASYPSSTTMLALCVMLTAVTQFNRLIKANKIKIAANVFSYTYIGVAVIGRLLSGVHWLTDILGGALLSAALVMLYDSTLHYLEPRQQSQDSQETLIE